MTDTGIFATTAEVQRHVPVGASSTANVEAYINQFIAEAENLINVTSLHNWSDDYSGLDADVKSILKLAAASWAAIQVIKYDFRGFPTLNYALSHINTLLHNFNTAMKELENKSKTNKFITGV